MKKLKTMACLSLSVCIVLSMPMAGYAAELEETGELISMEDVKAERLNNESESTVIYIDALGNYVFHNLPQQDVTRMQQEPIFVDETREVRESLVGQPSVYTSSEYTYDIENNPVHIGTWSGQKAYARHTNPDTGASVSVAVNDFGPQQNTELGKKTIVDLDADHFTTLFGSTKVGRHVCTTYVEVQQYFN